MSQKNVEILRRANEAFNRGDVEGFLAFCGDVDDRHVACLVHYRGKQRDSGLVIDFTAVDMWEFRGNKLLRGTLGYRDRESALEAVGISE
jgi:hypothetical protein